MKITTEGQITIPEEIRERLGLLPDTEVEFEVVDDCVQLRRVRPSAERVREILESMTGRATSGLTTDEIMALMRPSEPDDDR